MEKLLITNSDVNEIRDISQHLQKDRFDAYVRETQRVHLRSLLGASLYLDMFANITDPKYQDLWKGGITFLFEGDTIDYFGLKPYLSYTWLILFNREANNFYSNTGVREYSMNELTQKASMKDIIQGLGESANIYKQNIINFLDENNTTYPLWDFTGIEGITNHTWFIV